MSGEIPTTNNVQACCSKPAYFFGCVTKHKQKAGVSTDTYCCDFFRADTVRTLRGSCGTCDLLAHISRANPTPSPSHSSPHTASAMIVKCFGRIRMSTRVLHRPVQSPRPANHARRRLVASIHLCGECLLIFFLPFSFYHYTFFLTRAPFSSLCLVTDFFFCFILVWFSPPRRREISLNG